MCVVRGSPGVCEHGACPGGASQVRGQETSGGGAGGEGSAGANSGTTSLLTVRNCRGVEILKAC